MFRAATDDLHRMRRLAVAGVDAVKEQPVLREVLRQREGEAFTDRLTGLSNRRHFEVSWPSLFNRSGSAVVGMLDLDNFKGVNDTLGHEQGDALLRTMAQRFLSASRPGDMVCRLGGDEFALLLRAPFLVVVFVAAATAAVLRLAVPGWS